MRTTAGKLAVIGLIAGTFATAGPAQSVESQDSPTASSDKAVAVSTALTEPKSLDSALIDSEQGLAEIFVEANGLYEVGAHERAIELYLVMLQRGAEGGYVYFNLGNSFLRNGELGKAIAAYLRSRRALPRDQDVQANLRFARSSTKDAIEPPDPSPLLATLFFWHFGLSRAEILRLLIVLNCLFWGTCAARLFFRRSEVLRWTFVVTLVLVMAVGSSAVASVLAPRNVAVVIPLEIDAHTGPSADSVIRFKLHAGTELRIEDAQDGWFRVALPSGEQGWVDQSWVEFVEDSG